MNELRSKKIILRDPTLDGISESARAQVDVIVKELQEQRPKLSPSEWKKRVKETWYSFGNEDLAEKKMYFFRQLGQPVTRIPEEDLDKHLDLKYTPQPGDIVLEEGVDYFTSEEAAKTKKEEMKKEFISAVDDAHQRVVSGGIKEKIDLSTRMKQGVEFILGKDVQGDLELMHLLETTSLTDRKKADIAALFTPPSDPATDKLLNNILNPHPIAVRLFGGRIKYLCSELPEYTEEFSVGNETIFHREKDYHYPELHDIPFAELAFPQNDYFATHMDELFHSKLFRLADSFLGLNLAADDGVLAFENFVHTFDVSPGEYTLERCQTSPAPPHTYCELPIIKFDGYDEADIVPDGVVIPAKASSHH